MAPGEVAPYLRRVTPGRYRVTCLDGKRRFLKGGVVVLEVTRQGAPPQRAVARTPRDYDERWAKRRTANPAGAPRRTPRAANPTREVVVALRRKVRRREARVREGRAARRRARRQLRAVQRAARRREERLQTSVDATWRALEAAGQELAEARREAAALGERLAAVEQERDALRSEREAAAIREALRTVGNGGDNREPAPPSATMNTGTEEALRRSLAHEKAQRTRDALEKVGMAGTITALRAELAATRRQRDAQVQHAEEARRRARTLELLLVGVVGLGAKVLTSTAADAEASQTPATELEQLARPGAAPAARPEDVAADGSPSDPMDTTVSSERATVASASPPADSSEPPDAGA